MPPGALWGGPCPGRMARVGMRRGDLEADQLRQKVKGGKGRESEMITFWSSLRAGWGRRGTPWSLPCPESPSPSRTGSRTSWRSATNASAARNTGVSALHRRCWPRSRRCRRRSGIAGCGKRAGPRLGLVRQSPREFAGVCGRARAGRRGAGGSEAAVPASALRGSLRTQEGAARPSWARGAGGALRGPGSRSASASSRRPEKQQQVLRFSNPFQPLPLHQSALPERARGGARS